MATPRQEGMGPAILRDRVPSSGPGDGRYGTLVRSSWIFHVTTGHGALGPAGPPREPLHSRPCRARRRLRSAPPAAGREATLARLLLRRINRSLGGLIL